VTDIDAGGDYIPNYGRCDSCGRHGALGRNPYANPIIFTTCVECYVQSRSLEVPKSSPSELAGIAGGLAFARRWAQIHSIPKKKGN
jgi:hypothetical protein